jgi:hypothetical protein
VSAVYAGGKLRPLLLPAAPFTVATKLISRTLNNDFYPGMYGVMPYIAAPIALAVKLVGRKFSTPELKEFKKGFQLKAFCIAGGDWTSQLRRLEDHETWPYISHALAYTRTQDPQHVDAVWQQGLKQGRSRYVEEDTKIYSEEWERAEAAQYMERIAKLAAVMQDRGRLPWSDELARLSGRKDDEVGIAIGRDGELLHFRKGHHRMILAKQLGTALIDVELHVVHADWLRGLPGISRSRIRRAVEQPTEHGAPIRDAIADHLAKLH